MRRNLLAILLFLGSLSVGFANHQIGGYVTWRSVGPDTYVFTYVGFYDYPGMVQAPDLITNHPSVPQVPMTVVSSTQVQNGYCVGDTARIYRAESAPVTFSKPYPSGGLMVARRSMNLPKGNVNMGVTTLQFYPVILTEQATGSGGIDLNGPQWFSRATGVLQQVPLIFQNHGIDSVSFSFSSLPADVISNNPVPQFTSPYSGTTQLPDSSFASGSLPAKMDPYSGAIEFQSSVQGYFFTIRKVDHWRDGSIIATQYIMLPVVTANSTTNGDPNLNITTSTGYPSHSWSANASHKGYFLSPGDSLQVELAASDFDLDPNFNPQIITFTGYGDPDLNVQFSPKPPQGGFSNATNNRILAKIIVPSNLPISSLSRTLHVFGTFRDNNCPIRGIRTARVTLQIRVPFAMPDTMHLCSGDSLYLPFNNGYGSVSFNPSPVRTYNDTAVFWLTGSTVIQATHSTGYTRSCSVSYQATAKPQIAMSGGGVGILNPNDFDTYSIYFQDVPILVDQPQVPFPLTGDYYGYGTKNLCENESDTLQVNTYRMVNTNNPGEPVTGPQPGVGSFGTLITITASGGDLAKVRAIHLYGLASDSSTIPIGQTSIQVRDLNGGGAFQVDSLVAGQSWITAYGTGNMQNGKDYLVYVEADPLYSIYLRTPSSFPYMDPNGRVRVYNGAYSSSGGFPTTSSSMIPHFVIEGPVNLSVEEQRLQGVKVYPNPAQDKFTVELPTSLNGNWVLSDLTGRVMNSGDITGEQKVSVERNGLSDGMYILNIRTQSGSGSFSVIFE